MGGQEDRPPVPRAGARSGRLTIDGDEVIDGRFSLFLCVNTEYMGRDKVVFPDARIDDGCWDLIFCRDLSKLHLAEVMAHRSEGDGSWLSSAHVERRRVRSFELEACDPVNVDGESNLPMPLRFAVEPGAVRFMGASRADALS